MGVLVQQLIELLGKVPAHHVHLLDAGGEHGVEQRVDDALTLHANERLGRVQRDGNQAGAEPGGDEHRALDAIGFERFQARSRQHALTYEASLVQVGHRAVDRAYGQIGSRGDLSLRQRLVDTRLKRGQYFKILHVERTGHERTFPQLASTAFVKPPKRRANRHG